MPDSIRTSIVSTDPVLIVGAGPTGLMMALLLKRQGIACRIIDQHPQMTQTSNALVVQARTLEIWRDLGFLETAMARGIKVENFNIHNEQKKLLTIDFTTLESPTPFALGLPQHDTELLLIEQLQALGLLVERNKTLSNIEEDADSVIAKIKTADVEETLHCSWVIGCDGYHSTVRSLLKIDYAGSDLKEHFIMMDVPLVSPSLNSSNGHVFFHPDGLFAIFPLPACSRIIAEISHDPVFKDGEQFDVNAFKIIAQQRCRFPLSWGEPVWQSAFWVHERISDHYRTGHIFLMGDAAHAHSPAGGQGMNTGLQDAHNLAWKLAGVMQGKLSASLLDTYETERRPIAQKIIRGSGMLTKVASFKNPILVSMRNFLFSLISKTKLPKKIAQMISETNVSYAQSSHSAVGKRMLLGEQSFGYRFVLVIFSGAQSADEAEKLILQQYPDLIVVKPAEDSKSRRGYYVIRPDQYVGFCGENFSELKKYLASIFIGCHQ